MVELQVGVKVLLKNREGKYLLMRRSPQSAAPGKWDMPGGRINVGSTLMENLAREVREETGLELRGIPQLIAAQDLMPKPNIDIHCIRLTYICDAPEGEPHVSEEHTEHRWSSLDEMRKLDNLDRYLAQLVSDGIIS
jgi:8-oxo-dGTP diphosphatase